MSSLARHTGATAPSVTPASSEVDRARAYIDAQTAADGPVNGGRIRRINGQVTITLFVDPDDEGYVPSRVPAGLPKVIVRTRRVHAE